MWCGGLCFCGVVVPLWRGGAFVLSWCFCGVVVFLVGVEVLWWCGGGVVVWWCGVVVVWGKGNWRSTPPWYLNTQEQRSRTHANPRNEQTQNFYELLCS